MADRILAVTLNSEYGLLKETEKAWGICFGTHRKGQPQVDNWFPKSQCTLVNGVLRVPEWLARKNRMVDWLKLPGIEKLIWWE